MKIPHSISQIYADLRARYEPLSEQVKAVIERNLKNENWLYRYRLKGEESFYVKAQGRDWLTATEDIFACTIVVERSQQIENLALDVCNFFELEYRRPTTAEVTNKKPEAFVFDDLRLYLRLKQRDSTRETKDLIFECQIKTFLQHAWAIATHDLIYKSPKLGAWASARVAYQVKAMLEHAEVAIAEVEMISKSPILSMTSDEYQKKTQVYNDIISYGVDIGANGDRVVGNIVTLLKHWGYSWEQVWEWVLQETNAGGNKGLNRLSFSIYEVVVDAILCNDTRAVDKYESYLTRHQKDRLLVPVELLEKHAGLDKIGYTPETEKYIL